MDNRILELAGLLEDKKFTFPANKEDKKTKRVIDRVFGEVMSALGRETPNLSAVAKQAIRNGLVDAFEDGLEIGYDEGKQE